MIITDDSTTSRSIPEQTQERQPGDVINGKMFNSLSGPVTARMIGGGEYWIETLCIQTGCMRIDVCGKIDFTEFSMVLVLIDADGAEHDPDDFWLED